MNREWVTLAFGIVLVTAVAVVSVWQNYPSQPDVVEVPTTDQPAADPPAVAPAKPAAPTPTARKGPETPAPAATAAPAPRVDARILVVHKHRFGDCEGTLRAVPGTLTYSTTDKEDGFNLAFAEIDAFDLDADKKNLRIRRRGGRTWNFTTRDESGTALSTFHKEATRARR